MAGRDELIARKAEVQGRIRSLRVRVDAARASADTASADSANAGAGTGAQRGRLVARVRSLQAELDDLMAEEARLRLEIDRSPR